MAFSYDLLPPIVPEILPAFVEDKTQIFFSVGAEKRIKTIQYSITPQHQIAPITTFNVVNDFQQSSQSQQKYGNFYFLIDTSHFKLDTYYKIQLRISQKTFTQVSAIKPQYFSEWSSICLLKKIGKPQIIIDHLGKENSVVIKSIGAPLQVISGNVVFKKTQEKLKNYQIQLYQIEEEQTTTTNNDFLLSSSNSVLVLHTDILTPQKNNNYNFKYILPISLMQGTAYKLIFKYTTSSGYRGQSYFFFNSISQNTGDNLFNITLKPDEELGEMCVIISADGVTHAMENIIIRRASSQTNYLVWDDIKILQYNPKAVSPYKLVWRDKIIKSGIFYKYGVCILKRNGERGIFKATDISQQCVFDDMYLMSENKSLRIRYNPSVTNFKYNLNESVQKTLGSQFPFVKRNGHNFYRSFTVGGLITSYMDTHSRSTIPSSLRTDSIQTNDIVASTENESTTQSIFNSDFLPGPKSPEIGNFTTKADQYKNEQLKYQNYNLSHDIQQYEDAIYEREFRDAVYTFLYKNNVKLFRSLQEGNMLVKITDISFTPLEQLGRQLYSFSATATEIDKYSVLNCDKYNIQPIGEYKEIQDTQIYAGQIKKKFVSTPTKNISNNLLTTVYTHFTKDWKYLTTKDVNNIGTIPNNSNIKDVFVKRIYNLQIEIDSPPAPVKIDSDGQLQYLTINTLQQQNQLNYRNTPLGYIIILNGKRMFIKAAQQRRVVQNPNSDTKTEKFIWVGRYDLPAEVKVKELKLVGGQYSSKNKLVSGPTYVNLLMNYCAEIVEKNAEISITNLLHFENPGQLWGTFKPQQNLKTHILSKIAFEYSVKEKNKNNLKTENLLTTYRRNLDNIWWVNFEGPINAIVWVKTSGFNGNTIQKADNFERHILANGNLNLNGMTLKDVTYYSYIDTKNQINNYIQSHFLDVYDNGNFDENTQQQLQLLKTLCSYDESIELNEWLKDLIEILPTKILNGEIPCPEWLPISSTYKKQVYKPEYFIYDFCFGGVHLTEKQEGNTQIFAKTNEDAIIRKTEFIYYSDYSNINNINSNDIFTSFSKITNPKENVVYAIKAPKVSNVSTVNNNSVTATCPLEFWIYYNSSWFKFIKEQQQMGDYIFYPGDVLCPVDGIVNYYYEGSYQKLQLI